MKFKIPNILTIGRIIIVPIFIFTFFLPGFFGDLIPFFLFVLASFTDYLDGLLARLFKEESKLGELLDPIADKILVSTALLLLIMNGTIKNFEVIAAIIIITREIIISGLREFLAKGSISMPVTSLSKLKAFIQMFAIAVLLTGDFGNKIVNFQDYNAQTIGIILLWLSAAITLYTGYGYIVKGIDHALEMFRSGADIIDIGGESTRPGSNAINKKLEWSRIKKIIGPISKKIPISLDTRKPKVMAEGIKNKVELINDVSGLRYSSRSIEIIKDKKIPFILMHSIKTPKTMQLNIKYDNVVLDVYDFFKKNIALCEKKKIDKKSIILDPGIGFGKSVKQNLSLISNIGLFHSLGCPILLGSSRKSFIGKLHKNALEEKRLGGSISSVIYALNQGVQIFRVHDVFETSQAIKVFKQIK